MDRLWLPCFFLLAVGLALFWPSVEAGAANMPDKAESLYSQGIQHHRLAPLKQALQLFEAAANQHPQSYEANWKAARSCRTYAEYAKRQAVDGWKDICAKYGRKGMGYAHKAFELEPDAVEGHFFYGLCVGVYSDGVSIFTALKEGLKDKTRNHLEAAYRLDKTYRDGTPALALGRFWEVLPWLAGRDTDKALDYYREAETIMPTDSRFRPQLQVYLGGLLLDQGTGEARARQMLQQAAASDDPYFSQRARKLLQ